MPVVVGGHRHQQIVAGGGDLGVLEMVTDRKRQVVKVLVNQGEFHLAFDPVDDDRFGAERLGPQRVGRIAAAAR